MNAQQLKNSILQEAIEGRLVPQDPNDEPASVLLEKIRKEKARLVKEGKLKKKDLEEIPISEDEIPFDIPKSWTWCRVSEISDSFIGLTYKPTDVSTTGWIVLRSSNIQDGYLDYNDIVKVNVDVSEKLRVRVNDIIICARNGSKKLVGKSAIVREVNEPTTFGAFMAICRTQFYEYIAKYLLSPLFFQQLRKDSDTTTINQLTQKNFNRYVVPLPPLAEQKRIVEKIEELLPMVEEYGKAQESLDKLNEELPERLKKSILQEAIEGRLVPQNPNDEPASVLLEKIQSEKKRLVKEGKLKKKDLEEIPISEDEIPFKIPISWVWTRLGTLATLISGTSYQKGDVKKEGIRVLRGGNIQNYQLCLFDDDVFIPNSFMDEDKNIKIGDVIIVASTGSRQVIGKPAFIKQTCPDCQIGAFLRIIRPQFNDTIPYIHLFFNSEYYRENIRNKVKGTNIYNIKGEYLGQMLFPLPPLAEQKRIVEKIEQLFHEIDKMKQ